MLPRLLVALALLLAGSALAAERGDDACASSAICRAYNGSHCKTVGCALRTFRRCDHRGEWIACHTPLERALACQSGCVPAIAARCEGRAACSRRVLKRCAKAPVAACGTGVTETPTTLEDTSTTETTTTSSTTTTTLRTDFSGHWLFVGTRTRLYCGSTGPPSSDLYPDERNAAVTIVQAIDPVIDDVDVSIDDVDLDGAFTSKVRILAKHIEHTGTNCGLHVVQFVAERVGENTFEAKIFLTDQFSCIWTCDADYVGQLVRSE